MSDGHEDHEHDDEEESPSMAAHPSRGGGVPMVMTPQGLMTEEQWKHMQLAEQSYLHDMYRIFDELNEDQMTAFKRLMHAVTHQGTDLAEHLEGIATGILYTKFNVCMTCGINHMKELEQEVISERAGDDDGGDDSIPNN